MWEKKIGNWLFWLRPATKLGLPLWLSDKESACQCRGCRRHRFDPWSGKMPWRGKWQLTPVSLTGEAHGQRRLACYSPWGHKELDLATNNNNTWQKADRWWSEVCGQGRGLIKKLKTNKKHAELFSGHRVTLCPDCSGGYLTVSNWQNSPNVDGLIMCS